MTPSTTASISRAIAKYSDMGQPPNEVMDQRHGFTAIEIDRRLRRHRLAASADQLDRQVLLPRGDRGERAVEPERYRLHAHIHDWWDHCVHEVGIDVHCAPGAVHAALHVAYPCSALAIARTRIISNRLTV